MREQSRRLGCEPTENFEPAMTNRKIHRFKSLMRTGLVVRILIGYRPHENRLHQKTDRVGHLRLSQTLSLLSGKPLGIINGSA